MKEWLMDEETLFLSEQMESFLNDSSTELLSSFLPPPPPPLEEEEKKKQQPNHDLNYERKKSRAKLNRQELNRKFAQLMKVLKIHTPNQRFFSRVKLIEQAIARIQTLEQEVALSKLNTSSLYPSSSSAVVPQMMMWLPYVIPSAPVQTVQTPRKKKHKKPKQSLDFNSLFLHCCDSRVFGFCDPIDLIEACRVSVKWRQMLSSASDRLWLNLTSKRWRIDETQVRNLMQSSLSPLSNQHPYAMWQYLHKKNVIPKGILRERENIYSKVSTRGISAWGVLCSRSNCFTTRSVLHNGTFKPLQVVEFSVIVQNTASRFANSVRVAADHVSVKSSHQSFFKPLDQSHGSHLQPRICQINSDVLLNHLSPPIKEVVLHSFEFAVIKIFFLCPKLLYETDFLLSARELVVEVFDGSDRNRKLSLVGMFASERLVWEKYTKHSGGAISHKLT